MCVAVFHPNSCVIELKIVISRIMEYSKGGRVMHELTEIPNIANLNAVIPSFGPTGQLPVGDYAPSEDDFRKFFVTISGARETIYAGWRRHGQALQNAGLDKKSRQLLNGSYTSNKVTPGDIDIAVEVRIDGDFDLFYANNGEIFDLLSGPETKTRYDCDAYPIPIIPESNPDYGAITVQAIAYWTKWFGTARDGQQKGRIWAFTGEHP